MALSVVLNGQLKTFADLSQGSSVEAVLDTLDLRGDRIAVEVNGEILARDARAEAKLLDGDHIEVVHFVGGGCDVPSNATKQNICYRTLK